MLVEAWPDDPAKFRRVFRHALVILTVGAVGASVGFVIFAEPLVSLLYGARYSERNPMFVQWDFRIDKKWVFDRFLLDLYLDVQNLTNRSNVEAPDYNFDYRRKKTEGGMPIYPILGLRAEL